MGGGAILDYGDDVRGTFEIGLNDQKWNDEELTAYGVDQTIRIRFANPFLKNHPTIVEVIENDNGAFIEKKITVSYDEAYRAQLKHFYQCVVNREIPLTNVEEGRRGVELMAAMFKKLCRESLRQHAASDMTVDKLRVRAGWPARNALRCFLCGHNNENT